LDPTLVSKYAENVPLYVSLRRRAGSAMPNVRREDVQAFVLRATHPLPPYSRVLVHSGAARYRTAHLDYTLFREPGISNDLVVGDPVVVSTPLDKQELRNPRQEDLEAARKLITHVNEHLEHYHKAIWRMMDPERRFMLLDGYLAPNAGGRSVASVVENRLIGIVGNSLVMPVARGFHLDPTYNQDIEKPLDLLHHYAPTTPIPPTRISVPTRGVFAEAVMGSCNSCEEKDDTRFWRFEESPCPGEPTPIQPVSTDTRRAEPPDMTAKDLPAPIINLQNAPALPDPTGLGAALQLLGTPNLFRDITGLEGNQRNALAAFTASLDAAKSFAGEASKLAMQKALSKDSDKNIKAIKQAKEAGLLTEQQANSLTESALRGQIGDKRKPDKPLTDEAEVKDLLKSAAGSDSADVALTSGDQTVAVKTGTPETLNVNVPGSVPPIAQRGRTTCWAAVTAMLLSWRDGTTYTLETAMDNLGPTYRGRLDRNEPLPAADKAALLRDAGFQGLTNLKLSVRSLRALLEKVGPLWITTDEDPTEGFSIHARVLVGMSGDGSPAGTTLRIIDPNGGRLVPESFAEFARKFEEEVRTSVTDPKRIRVVHVAPR
jgi:hypothetical protein